MKKSIIALSAVMFLAIGVANAQTEKNTHEAQPTQQVDQTRDKVEIKRDALPERVKEVIKSDRFNTWDVSKVYETTEKNKKVYEVVFKNGEKTATYKFDEEGKTIG